MGKAARVQFEWVIKVTPDNKKYLASTATEKVQRFMSDRLQQLGADTLRDELYTRGVYAGLGIPSAQAAEARGDKDWEPIAKVGQEPDLFRDSEDIQTILNVWRDACERSTAAHTKVMEALGSKQDALSKSERKLSYAKSSTTMQNRLDLTRELDASVSQQRLGASIHREYLNSLIQDASEAEVAMGTLASHAYHAAANEWGREHTMYQMKMKPSVNKKRPESASEAVHMRYFPALAKSIMAIDTTCATVQALHDLCASALRLEEARGSAKSVLETWGGNVANYKWEVSELKKQRQERQKELDKLSDIMRLEKRDLETLQFEDVRSLTEVGDAETFRKRISTIAESKRPKPKPQRVPRPIAPLPVFTSDQVIPDEDPRPDFKLLAETGNKTVQNYLRKIGATWYKSSVEEPLTKVSLQVEEITLRHVWELDKTWELVKPRARRAGEGIRSSGGVATGDDQAGACSDAERPWKGYYPYGTMGYFSKMGRVQGMRRYYEFLELPLTGSLDEIEQIMRTRELLGAYESPRMKWLRKTREARELWQAKQRSKLRPSTVGAESARWRQESTRTDFQEVLEAEVEAAKAAPPPSRSLEPAGKEKSMAHRTWEKWQAIRRAQFPELKFSLRSLLPPEERGTLDADEFSQVYDEQLAEGGCHYGFSQTYEENSLKTGWEWASVRPRAQSFGGYPSDHLSTAREHVATDSAVEPEYSDGEETSNAE